MRADDPRLVAAHERLTARVQAYDERLTTVLKNHLACEQSLDELLKAASRRWRGRTFKGKIDVAKTLLLPELEEQVWTVLEAGNKLRNAVAHGHKEGAIASCITELRKAYLACSSPEQQTGIKEMTDIQVIMSAFNHCGSFIVVAAEQLTQPKKH